MFKKKSKNNNDIKINNMEENKRMVLPPKEETKKEKRKRLKEEKIRKKEFEKEKKKNAKNRKKNKDSNTSKHYSININDSNIPLDDSRYVVLAVLFQQIRNLFGDDVYCEMIPVGIDTVFPLPYKFNTFDIVSLAKYFKFKELYIEMPDGSKYSPYISISYHEIEMQCKTNIYEEIKELFLKLEKIDFDFDLYSFDISKFDDISYDYLNKYIFANLVHMGNELFHEGGYISVFKDDGKEIIIRNEKLLREYRDVKFDYFVVRSSEQYKSIIYIPYVTLFLAYGIGKQNYEILDKIINGVAFE